MVVVVAPKWLIKLSWNVLNKRLFGLRLCHEQMMHLDEQTIENAELECTEIIR